jgi:hypothetical protein
MEVQPPLKRCEIGYCELEESHILFENIGLFEVEVVNESPSPKFNSPLTNLEVHILIQVWDIFCEPFSLFKNPYTMLRPSIFSLCG